MKAANGRYMDIARYLIITFRLTVIFYRLVEKRKCIYILYINIFIIRNFSELAKKPSALVFKREDEQRSLQRSTSGISIPNSSLQRSASGIANSSYDYNALSKKSSQSNLYSYLQKESSSNYSTKPFGEGLQSYSKNTKSCADYLPTTARKVSFLFKEDVCWIAFYSKLKKISTIYFPATNFEIFYQNC